MSKFRPHGANPEKLYMSMGMEMPGRVIDFSTNTNALEWSGSFDFNLDGLLSRYPDDEAVSLRDLLARKNNRLPEEILITNGSNEAIYLLASYCSWAEANHVLQPSYGEYARALGAWGINGAGIFDIGEIKADAGSIWICNPNNPTGAWIRPEIIAEAAAGHPQTMFIIDEAYIDFLTEDGEKADLTQSPNLVILRSLTKLYRLCGARLGYVMADRRVIQRLKTRQPTWSVNGVAQAAAAAFLRDEDYPRRTREFYSAETRRFIGRIRDAGWSVRPTSVNFFLVETDDDERLITFLLRRGLVVRHTRNFRGLDGKFVRISTRLPEENDMLVDALREFSA